MGSANINDRSQKGDGDSEIALVVEDGDMVDSTMDGEPYQVSRFAASLRRKLFRGPSSPPFLPYSTLITSRTSRTCQASGWGPTTPTGGYVFHAPCALPE